MLSKMQLLKLVGFVAVFCIVASPAGTLASLVVFPDLYDFGNILVGQTGTTIVTVSNLGTEPVEFSPTLIGDTTTFRIESDVPSIIEPGDIFDIEITFHPGDEGYFSSTLPVAGTGGTSFGGVGVWSEPTPSEAIVDILNFFDTSVVEGTLVGDGPGSSADGRRGALSNQIESAGDLISDGCMEEASDQLMNAYLRCDGLARPPEFVAGPAASTLAGMILELAGHVRYLQAGLITRDLVSENGNLLGQARLCYDENTDETDIRVNCWSLEANTVYTVLLCKVDYDGNVTDYIQLVSLNTTENGNATLSVSVNGDVSAWCAVVGAVDDGGVYAVFAYAKIPIDDDYERIAFPEYFIFLEQPRV